MQFLGLADLWCEQLLTSLSRQQRIIEAHHTITKGAAAPATGACQLLRQHVLLNHTTMLPRGKVPGSRQTAVRSHKRYPVLGGTQYGSTQLEAVPSQSSTQSKPAAAEIRLFLCMLMQLTVMRHIVKLCPWTSYAHNCKLADGFEVWLLSYTHGWFHELYSVAVMTENIWCTAKVPCFSVIAIVC